MSSNQEPATYYHVKLGTIRRSSQWGTHRGTIEQQYLGRYSQGPVRALDAESAIYFRDLADAQAAAEEHGGEVGEGRAHPVITTYHKSVI